MREGSVWEVKLLRYVCIGLLIILSIANVDHLINLTGTATAITIRLIGFISLPILCLFIAIKVEQKIYPQLLIIFIFGFHVLNNIIFFGSDFDGMALSFDERLGEGRWVDYVFRYFPLISVGALAFLRIWAVLLWLLLSTISVIRPLFFAFQNPLLYFENDWEKLLVDGFAVNAWMLREQLLIQLFFVIAVISIFLFNKKLVSSTIESEKLSLTLGRYFSPDIQKEIQSSSNQDLKNEPLELKVAIIFTDLVGFTKLSEKMNPKDVLKLLSEYQGLMVDSIFKHKGTVDKFIGDAVMANFGTPRSRGNDAQNALECAVEMNKKLSEWNLERSKEGLPKIEHRIGIHFGDCVAGNMGNDQRMEFAVIGDAVNVASRICDACKDFDSNFLISSELAQRVSIKERTEHIKGYSIRGRKEPVDLVKIYID